MFKDTSLGMIDALTFYRKCTPYPVDYITPGVQVKPVWYRDYRKATETSFDLLLHTPTSYCGRAIARHTGGPGYNFCHAEAVVWWNLADRMMTCGYQEGLGGVARPLSQAVVNSNGSIHVYRVSGVEKSDVRCLASHLAGDLGREYGWNVILLQLLALLPIARWLLPDAVMTKLVMSASSSSGVGICSQHVARSFRRCGILLIDKLDAMVTPNDLAQSALTTYVCTLVKGGKDDIHDFNRGVSNIERKPE